MKKIGFENFRAFKSFEPLELKGINYLVGQNSSGKSSFVKGLLLLKSFLDSNHKDKKLNFSPSNYEGIGINTYSRALHNSASENQIIFKAELDNHYLELKFTGSVELPEAELIEATFSNLKTSLNIHYLKGTTYFKRNKFSKKEEEENFELKKLLAERSDSKKRLKNIKEKTSNEFIRLSHKVQNLESRLKLLRKSNASQKSSPGFDFKYAFGFRSSLGQTIWSIVQDIEDDDIHSYSLDSKVEKNRDAFLANLKEVSSLLQSFYHAIENEEEVFDEIPKKIFPKFVYYLDSSFSKQIALLNINDKKNQLAQTVTKFMEAGLLKNETLMEFLHRWMKKFNLGEKFEINLHAGEAYEVLIIDGKNKVNISDKGTGSIQAFLLLLRIATVFENYYEFSESDSASGRYSALLLIEEPELNLHPAFQSLLTDLFYECHEKYHISFIIETHSEYMIRRSQVMVKEKELEVPPNDNPFNTIYFDHETKKQWKMIYRKDGKFENEFGKGFYDEAGLLTLDLL